MYSKMCNILNIFILFLLYYENIILTLNIDSLYNNSQNTVGYYPNSVTGLFTKLIGIASVVGLSFIKCNKFISTINIYFFSI